MRGASSRRRWEGGGDGGEAPLLNLTGGDGNAAPKVLIYWRKSGSQSHPSRRCWETHATID